MAVKIEFDLQMRALTAELYRRRAASLRKTMNGRTMSAARQEMEAEAAYLEQRADALMDYIDTADTTLSGATIRNSNIDIDSLDEPTKGNGKTGGGE